MPTVARVGKLQSQDSIPSLSDATARSRTCPGILCTEPFIPWGLRHVDCQMGWLAGTLHGAWPDVSLLPHRLARPFPRSLRPWTAHNGPSSTAV